MTPAQQLAALEDTDEVLRFESQEEYEAWRARR